MDDFEKSISLHDLRLAVHANCTCGGGDPETGCPACQAWHAIQDILEGEA